MGQSSAQMPQAMHLEGGSSGAACTIRPRGHTSTHLPQRTRSFLLIMQTPLAFWEMALATPQRKHFPHRMQVRRAMVLSVFSVTRMQALLTPQS